MEHFFPDAATSGGVFFEMGAIDGVKLSNTYLLERMGWRGLLIEANPLAAKMLFHNRPNSIGMNAAVCNRHQEVTYWTTGLISATGGIREFMTADFVKHWYPDGDGHKEWPLHCMPLGDIFDLVGMKHINFASIDVEGAEVAVLDSVDWNKVQVDVMCIEANEPVEKLVKALEGTPLKFYKEEKRNAWFLNENVPSLARKLRKTSARKHAAV